MSDNGIKILRKIDYSKSYCDLQNFCIEKTKLVLFGEFGDPSCPSISDLDVFICLKNENFIEDRALILNFIKSDETRNYLFFHDPIIIPEELFEYLRYFHTLYNLNFSFNPENRFINKNNTEYVQLLNLIWTSFLLVVGPNFIASNKWSVRDKLLVLKNICQSNYNIDENSKALDISVKVRELVLKGELTENDVDLIFYENVLELYEKTNSLKSQKKIKVFKNAKKFKIEKDMYLHLAKENSFSILNGKKNLFLNPFFFNFFEQFYYKKVDDENLKIYINKYIEIGKILNKYKINSPFIAPFSFNFYRKDARFFLRKIIYSFNL